MSETELKDRTYLIGNEREDIINRIKGKKHFLKYDDTMIPIYALLKTCVVFEKHYSLLYDIDDKKGVATVKVYLLIAEIPFDHKLIKKLEKGKGYRYMDIKDVEDIVMISLVSESRCSI